MYVLAWQNGFLNGRGRLETIPKSHVFVTGTRGRGISRCEVDKWSAPLIEPFGQATRTFIASASRVKAEWARFLRNGRLGAAALFLRQKVLVHIAGVSFGRGREEENISSVPKICQNGGKRAKNAFPTSMSLNGPQSQKRHHLECLCGGGEQ